MKNYFYTILRASLSLAFCLALLLAGGRLSLADNTSAWTGQASPTLQSEGTLPPSISPPFSWDGNRDCSDHTFVTQPSGPILLPPFFQSEQSFTACGVLTGLGIIEPNGYADLTNNKVAGRLVNYQSNNSALIPIPESMNLLHYTSAPISGLYLFLTKNVAGSFTTSLDLHHSPIYSFNRPDDLALRDKAGTLLPVQPDSMSFSENGKWMVVDADNRAMLRVNLETLEILPFGPAFNYNIGLNPHPQTSITNDGRYVVVGSTTFNTFKVYDLQSCTNIPTGTLTGPANCQSKELWSYMQQQIASLKSIITIRFMDDYLISLYANTSAASASYTKYILSAAGYNTQKISYLALGDSFASGEGAYDYQENTNTPTNRCHSSLVSYPFLLGDDLSLSTANSVACSGANMNDVTNAGADYRGQVKDGLTRKARSDTDIQNIVDNYWPGYINQLDFVKIYRPKVITVSMVGNDIGFGNIIKRCLEPDTCYSTYEDRLELVREINSKFDNLVGLYQKLKAADSPDSKIYVIGYPSLIYSGGNCAANVRLNNAEGEFANQLVSYLNTFIAQAAKKAGVAYVDVESALAGHRLCETKSSNVAINGLSLNIVGPTEQGPLAPESYHPNKLGHQLLEQTILDQTQSLHLTMPTAVSSASLPAESGLDILNAPKSGRTINGLNYDNDLSNDVIYRQRGWQITVKAGQTALKSVNPYHILIDGVVLGTATTSDNGELDSTLQLPANTSIGLHQIDVMGDDASGQPIDITKTVIIGNQPGDIDGNNVQDDPKACTFIPRAGQDNDLDFIDDSCDGFIDDNPLPAILYRARQGDPAKGEKTDSIYLERNVHAAGWYLGLGDYDPDGDGWALVAKANGLMLKGSIAKLWIDQMTSMAPNVTRRYVPHISVRTQRSGCLQLTPEKVTVVRRLEQRHFVTEPMPINKCRGEGADQDHDGFEDVSQPLYRVKYGDPLRGQDSQKIYLERNITAAEAQLGISDYSQTGDSWSVVGSTKQPKEYLAGLALADPKTNQILTFYPLDWTYSQVTTAVGLLSDTQRQTLMPMAILRSDKNICRAMAPYRLTVVRKGQGRRMVVPPNFRKIPCPAT